MGVIGFMPGSASTMEREEGLPDETRRGFPRIEIAGVQFGLVNRAKATAVTENLLTAHAELGGP